MRNLIITLFLIVPMIVVSQVPMIEWQNSVGGDQLEFLRVLKPLSDGNYIVAGFSDSGISGEKTVPTNGFSDFWLFKMDTEGTILWQRGYGGDSEDELFAIEETSDGGFILGSDSTSGISGDKTEPGYGVQDYWVLKTDASGTIQWQITLGGSNNESLYTTRQTADGGYIVGGYSSSDASGNKSENSNGLYDFWVVKLSAAGDIEWQNTIGGSEDDFLWDLELSADGGYLLAGTSESGVSGDKTEPVMGVSDIWLVKLDSNGTIEWDETIGGDGSDSAWSILGVSDGFLLGGRSSSGVSGDKTEPNIGAFDIWVLKIDESGTIVWQNTIGGTLNDQIQAPNCVNETLDGGYILGSWSESDAGGDKTEDSRGIIDYWVVKVDANGIVEWDKTIGGEEVDLLRSVIQKPDGNYLVAGRSDSGIGGDKTDDTNGTYDYWILELSPTLNIIDQNLASAISIYPNPVDETLFFSAGNNHITRVNVLSLNGQLIKTYDSPQNNINLSGLISGIYLIEMISGDKSAVKKLVKQ